MSFFKDLKEDIAQSVNELAESFDEEYADVSMSADSVETEEPSAPEPVGDAVVLESETVPEPKVMPELEIPPSEPSADVLDEEVSEEILPDLEVAEEPEFIPDTPEPEIVAFEEDTTKDIAEELQTEEISEEEAVEIAADIVEEENPMSEEMTMPAVEEESMKAVEETNTAGDAKGVTVITKGTTINGGISSDTSLVVEGVITGDVECQGKLTIKGRVEGNTIASEIYVQTPKLEGDINSKGIVKIDVGTVVIGNISCTSVLVSGAIKGNIEVNGPVIVDSTAVVKGDIKAKSIQINSGAVIDGHCSLQFADVDLDSFFE